MRTASEGGGSNGNQKCLALIIGVGNELRRDDGVGVEAARRIDKLNIAGTRVLLHSGEGASLLELFREADLIFLIDAVKSDSPPGTVHYLDAGTSQIPGDFFNYSTHAFSVAEAVEMARVLNRLPRRLLIYGIEGADFSAGVGLTEAVQLSIDSVVTRMERELREITGAGSS